MAHMVAQYRPHEIRTLILRTLKMVPLILANLHSGQWERIASTIEGHCRSLSGLRL